MPDPVKIFSGDALQLVSAFGIDASTGAPYWMEGAAAGSVRSDAGHLVAAIVREIEAVGATVDIIARNADLSESGRRRQVESAGHDALLKLARWAQQAGKIKATAIAYRAGLMRQLEPEGDVMFLELRSHEIRNVLRSIEPLERTSAIVDAANAGDRLTLAAVRRDPAGSFAPLAPPDVIREADTALLAIIVPNAGAELEGNEAAISGMENAVAVARSSIIALCRLTNEDAVLLRTFPDPEGRAVAT